MLIRMRVVAQRVTRASVTVDGAAIGEIGKGLLLLVGVGKDDSEADADYLAEKVMGLRVFEDDAGKMNLSVLEANGELLAVSQFTLYGDVRRGKRPSFDEAALPEQANQLYEYFVTRLRAAGARCETGRFRAMMQVELVNDGPVTLLMDSNKGVLAGGVCDRIWEAHTHDCLLRFIFAKKPAHAVPYPPLYLNKIFAAHFAILESREVSLEQLARPEA